MFDFYLIGIRSVRVINVAFGYFTSGMNTLNPYIASANNFVFGGVDSSYLIIKFI